MDLMLPIVQKITNGQLILQDYAVTEGQINGLSKAITMTKKLNVGVFYLDNCQMTD